MNTSKPCKRTINVLVADDHLLMRLGIKFSLERMPDIHVIGEASNGREALDKFDSLRPDVVVMDVSMPEMDGIVASSKIRQIDPDAHILMMFVHEDYDDILASMAVGAAGYCLKSSAPERLQEAVCAVNGGYVWLDSGVERTVEVSSKTS